MNGFSRVALLHAHPRLPLLHAYHLSDLIELCGLAACIRDQVEEVWIPVTPVDRDPVGGFRRFMAAHRPDLVGISCFTCGASAAQAYAAIAKEHDAVVVMGGFHPSALPDEVLASSLIDIVVRGEGELTLQELVRTGDPAAVAGVSYRRHGAVVHNPDRPLIDDLDSLPLPLRELRPPRFGLRGLAYHTDTIFASRGCKGSCSFCANHLVGKQWRQRSNQRIIEELLTIPPPQKKPWKIVKFWDSNFLTDVARIEQLCDLIISHGLQRSFRFMAETRVEDVIRAREILPRMREAGFARIGCGIESPNRETHRQLHKGINLKLVEQAAALLTGANMMLSKFLIIGHSNETAADILAYPDYSLAHGAKRQNTTFFIMTPYPGTRLAEQYREQGLIKSKNWDLYTNLGAVIAPNGISPLELQALHCAVVAQYGMARRFLLGKRLSAIVTRLLEAVLVYSLACQAAETYEHDQVVQHLLQALARLRGSRTRPVQPRRRRRFLDDAALWLHGQGAEPVLIGVLRGEDEEELLIADRRSVNGSRLAALRPVHLDLDRLVRAAGSISLRRLAHDSLTSYWNLRAFKLSWLPGFARELTRLLGTVVGLTGFHLRRRLGSASDPAGS